MAEVWEPQPGETVQIVDRESNDFGKVGKISLARQGLDGPNRYGVTFGDNVLRYFSREGLTWVSSPTAQPATEPGTIGPNNMLVLPRKPIALHFEPIASGDVLATLTLRGEVSDLLALAAELVKRG